MRSIFLPLLPVLLLAGCTTPSTPGQQTPSKLRMVQGSRATKPIYGTGQNGRMVDGVKVYTVTVEFLVLENGKVRDVQVFRSDAPERLQRAVVEAVEKYKFNPSAVPRVVRQNIICRGLEVEPG